MKAILVANVLLPGLCLTVLLLSNTSRSWCRVRLPAGPGNMPPTGSDRCTGYPCQP